ncbi:unnamed protein product [Linum tenue]|uniref:F-box protein n=1 Tax=Linum tenue TaxID=586396 RepID=A0AAV0QG58_9ROSI|nr:unnamed protein product [Linum tenue]
MVALQSTVDSSSNSASSATISAVHHDVLRSHILNRLDGPALAALSSASPDLRSTISTDDELWRNICAATWPSVNNPELSSLIPTFNHGYRSFFSDSFPAIHLSGGAATGNPDPEITGLISAVDIYYGDSPIFSKVTETETVTSWFQTAPFRIELLEAKEVVPTATAAAGKEAEDAWLRQLEENLRVSWIVIDPAGRRSANLSSGVAVAARHHWLTGEVQVKFSTVAAEGAEGEGGEAAECGVVVTCGGEEGGEVHVRDIYLGMEDMEGRSLCGRDSLGILRGAMEGERRRRVETREEGKEKYERFLERKREWKRRVERREKVLDTLCVATGVAFFLTFLAFLLM